MKPKLLALGALLLSFAATRAAAQAPIDSTFYSVSHIDVNPASRSTVYVELQEYRDAARKDAANVRIELFEQTDRPGHLAIIETWKTQAAFDARAAARKQLSDAIQPMRTSNWDTRPYKMLTVSPAAAATRVSSIVVITHIDVSPDPKVAAMVKVLAEASRREEGNLRFDVLQHTMRANHFEIIETWQSAKALDAHAAAAHTRQYRDDLQPFLGSPLDERVFKAIE